MVVDTSKEAPEPPPLSSTREPRGAISCVPVDDVGFSLAEVASLLALDDGMHCAAARQLAEYEFREVRKKRRDLHRMESALKSAVADRVSAQTTMSPG